MFHILKIHIAFGTARGRPRFRQCLSNFKDQHLRMTFCNFPQVKKVKNEDLFFFAFQRILL